MKINNNNNIDLNQILELSTYNGNQSIKPAGVQMELTPEQVEEFIKCSEDPIYFINNYVRITTLDEGVQLFHTRDYQERFIHTIMDNRFTISMQPRQVGKCCGGNTKYTVRNKKTGEIYHVTAKEFHERIKKQKASVPDM